MTRVRVIITGAAAEVGSLITNPLTGRVRMVVATSGPSGVGAWQDLRRNVVERLLEGLGRGAWPSAGAGILTDSDNTGATVDAWYGDIRFVAADP